MIILIWVIGSFALVLAWAVFVEPNWYRLKRISIHLPKKVRKPFTILHLSDVHFQKKMGSKKHIFQRLSMLNPDLIFLTGDIIDCDDGIDTAVRLLAGLRARYGTFFIFGNHDYYDYRLRDVFLYHVGFSRIAAHRNNSSRFAEELKRIGITVLVNQSVRLEVHGNHVLIGGTDDPVTQKIDFERALRGLSAETVNILLTHHLDSVLKLSHHGVDLVFSGHTHGGQLRIPFLGPVVCETKLPRRYISGLHIYNGMTACVSRGMGASRFTFPRFACRPEAIFVEVLP